MFERCGNAYKFMALKRLCLFILVAFSACFLGCGYTVVGNVQGYEAFLKDYKRYSSADSGLKVEKIEGFEPVVDEYFSFGKAFCDGIAFVRKENENYVLRRDGTLTQIAENLSEVEIEGGKYAFESNGKFGVKNVFGIELLAPIYSEINIADDTILAISDEYAETFYARYDSKEAVLIKKCNSKDATLLNGEYLFSNGYICDLNFLPLTACGLFYANLPCEGKVVVKLQDAKFGYVDLSANKILQGCYVVAHSFSEGTATAVMPNGENVVIDESGTKLFGTDNMRIGNKSYGFYCYESGGKYGILNDKFERLTDAIFTDIKYEKSVSGYFIISQNGKDKIYSPTKGDVYDCEEIIYEGRMFFCNENGLVTVLDNNLKKLFSCDGVEYGNGVLIVEKGGKYAYYERIQ